MEQPKKKRVPRKKKSEGIEGLIPALTELAMAGIKLFKKTKELKKKHKQIKKGRDRNGNS